MLWILVWQNFSSCYNSLSVSRTHKLSTTKSHIKLFIYFVNLVMLFQSYYCLLCLIIKKTISSLSHTMAKNMKSTPMFNKRSLVFMTAPVPSMWRSHRKILMIRNSMTLLILKLSQVLCLIIVLLILMLLMYAMLFYFRKSTMKLIITKMSKKVPKYFWIFWRGFGFLEALISRAPDSKKIICNAVLMSSPIMLLTWFCTCVVF